MSERYLRVLNITIESASAIEKMVNKAIDDIHKQKIKIEEKNIYNKLKTHTKNT